MIHIVLASWLLTQQWAWLKSSEPDVVAYRIYWGASGTAWCAANRVEIPATQCDLAICGVDGMCCGDIPEPGYSAFVTVAAVDSAGNESLPDHGNVVTCP